jgi:hypothetical protein
MQRDIWVFILFVHSHLNALLLTQKGLFQRIQCNNGKIGRLASEEDVLTLFRSKCLPLLLYGLQAFPLKKIASTVLRPYRQSFLYEIVQDLFAGSRNLLLGKSVLKNVMNCYQLISVG